MTKVLVLYYSSCGAGCHRWPAPLWDGRPGSTTMLRITESRVISAQTLPEHKGKIDARASLLHRRSERGRLA